MPPKKGKKSNAAKFSRTKRKGEHAEYDKKKRAKTDSLQGSTLSDSGANSDAGTDSTIIPDVHSPGIANPSPINESLKGGASTSQHASLPPTESITDSPEYACLSSVQDTTEDLEQQDDVFSDNVDLQSPQINIEPTDYGKSQNPNVSSDENFAVFTDTVVLSLNNSGGQSTPDVSPIKLVTRRESKPLVVSRFWSSPGHGTSASHADEALREQIVVVPVDGAAVSAVAEQSESSLPDKAFISPFLSKSASASQNLPDVLSMTISIGESRNKEIPEVIEEDEVAIPVPELAGCAVGEQSGLSLPDSFIRPLEPSTSSIMHQKSNQPMEMPVSEFLDTLIPEDISRSLQAVKAVLKNLLPKNWIPLLKDDGIHVGLLAPTNSFIVQRSLLFFVDGGIAATVHGQTLPESHDFWMNVDNVALKTEDASPFVNNIVRVVSHLRSFEVCRGVDEFRSLWKTEKNTDVDRNLFHEMRHGEVLRARPCQVLVRCSQRKCYECGTVRRRLNERKIADDNRIDATPLSKKPDTCCNSAEKASRSKRKNAKIESQEKENRRLRRKIGKLLQKEGVSLDRNTSSDLASILEHSEEEVRKLTYFQQIFIEQQVQAAKAKRLCSMRWHPAIIKLALSIRAKSGAAYEELSGVLCLPSERTLFDYSHSMSTSGIVDTLEITDLEISSISNNEK